jgi:hypothetical protein
MTFQLKKENCVKNADFIHFNKVIMNIILIVYGIRTFRQFYTDNRVKCYY